MEGFNHPRPPFAEDCRERASDHRAEQQVDVDNVHRLQIRTFPHEKGNQSNIFHNAPGLRAACRDLPDLRTKVLRKLRAAILGCRNDADVMAFLGGIIRQGNDDTFSTTPVQGRDNVGDFHRWISRRLQVTY